MASTRSRLFVFLALGAPGCAPAPAGPPGPPELRAVAWYHAPPWRLADLRGRAVLLEAFRTWCAPCAAQVPHLNELAAEDGLVVISVTDEDPELVEAWIERTGATHPIAALEDDALERAHRVRAFPTAIVLDPRGERVFAGDPRDARPALERALAHAERGPLLPPTLRASASRAAEGATAAAWRALDAAADGPARETAGAWRAHFAARALHDVARARAEASRGGVFEAVRRLRPWAELEDGPPAAAEARALLDELAARPGHARELAGGERYAAGLAAEAGGLWDEADRLYAGIEAELGGTHAAERASARRRKLAEAGRLGLDPGCERCAWDGRACAAHARSPDVSSPASPSSGGT